MKRLWVWLRRQFSFTYQTGACDRGPTRIEAYPKEAEPEPTDEYYAEWAKYYGVTVSQMRQFIESGPGDADA